MIPFSTPPTKSQILERITEYLKPTGGITALEHNEIETALLDVLFTDRPLLGDIKEVACSGEYISTNFETSGNNIGRGRVGSERYGWAICNGSNGTIDKRGRVGIGYDPINYKITTAGSNTGGSENAVVVSHTHTFEAHRSWNTTLGLRFGNNDGVETGNTTGTTSDASSGTSGVGKNMQPYIVTLFIQKIETPYA